MGTVVLALAGLAACNGGSSTSVPVFGPTASPSPPAAVPTLAPASAATTLPLAAGSQPAQTVAIPAAAGLAGSIVLPAATLPAGTSLDVQTSTVAPSGIPALSFGRRPLAAGGSGLEALYYQGLRFTQTVTFPGYPAFTITLPAAYDPAVGTYGLAFYDGSGWSYPIGAAGVPNGRQIAFASAAGPVTYQANQSYYFALYYAPRPPSPAPSPTASPTSSPTAAPSASPSASPSAMPSASPSTSPSAEPSASPSTSPSATPTPTTVPTPTPTPTARPLTVTPAALSFNGTGSDLTATVQIASSFFAGTFSASSCAVTTAGATPPPAVATVGAVDANGRFTVTPQRPGACTIDVSDSSQRHAHVSVTVATSSLTVQSRKH